MPANWRAAFSSGRTYRLTVVPTDGLKVRRPGRITVRIASH